jgi:hypothetical protein
VSSHRFSNPNRSGIRRKKPPEAQRFERNGKTYLIEWLDGSGYLPRERYLQGPISWDRLLNKLLEFGPSNLWRAFEIEKEPA